MITGEYAVMDGADALAIPTSYGQKLSVKSYNGSDLIWESLDSEGNVWFSTTISLYDFSAVKTTDPEKSKTLQNILKNAVRLNPEFLDKWKGFRVQTKLEFPLNWGLGSSSTLVHLVASWADVNPLELFFKIFDGSGYDVACAGSDTPIVYYNDEDEIGYTPVDFDPPFKDNLFFVHLGEKKNTQDAIKDYLKNGKSRKSLVKAITVITEKVLEVTSLSKFGELMDEHESLVSASIGQQKVKDRLFPDFSGCIKSMGAWGGDFVMAISTQSETETKEYFINKGYTTVIPYEKMICRANTPVLK